MHLSAQPYLPLIPPQAIPIGLAGGLLETEQGGAVFLHGLATFAWGPGDVAARRWTAIQLLRLKAASASEISTAFGIDRSNLWRWRFQEEKMGLAGLLPDRPGPRGPSRLSAEMVARIQVRDQQGGSLREIAAAENVSTDTVRRALGRGSKAKAEPIKPPAEPSSQSEASQPPLPAVPAPRPRLEERRAARAGVLEEAAPVFTEGTELPLMGLLLVLPALVETGLLEAGQAVYGKLRNGFYGLRSFLLTLLFTALLREPRAEGVSRIPPADLGRVLGLDRAPEVKTIRRRLAELSERHLGEELVRVLARHHAQARSDALGFLYLDGHVRVYSGTRKLPKAHITRLRISGPATEETWVADAHGEPVFVVTTPPGNSMVAEMRRLLPELRALVGERRLTICFDRGGWSPELFFEIVEAGFDFLTYRKGQVRKEPPTAFQQVVYQADGHRYEYDLADRPVSLQLPARKDRPRTLKVRQVIRRLDDHQTTMVTSRQDLSSGEIAHRMFSRWRQENYFRYARRHFGLDALDSYRTQPDDLQRSVPNPARSRLRRQLARAQQRLTELEADYGQAAHTNSEGARPTMRGFKIAHSDLGRLLDAAKAVVAHLAAEFDRTPTRLTLAEVAPDSRLLDADSKLLTHAVRMSAFNAESALVRLVAPHYRRAHDEARALLLEAFRISGDLQIVDGRLEVRLNPLSAPRRTSALAALCRDLNDTETPYPGTDLVLRYSVKQPPTVA